MRLSSAHWRFLWFDQGVIPAVIDLVINGLVAWAMFGSQSHVPVFGLQSVAGELLATGFLLPFLTCVITARIVRGQVRSGKLAPLEPEQLPQRSRFLARSSRQGVLLGLLGILFGAATIPWVLYQWPSRTLETEAFITFKAIWAGLFGLCISPFIGWWALVNASRGKFPS
jgi:hypothetical protein